MTEQTGSSRTSEQSGQSTGPAPRPAPPAVETLKKVQALAGEWVRVITTFTGLIGLSGVVFGNGAITDLSLGWRKVAVGLLIGSLLCGACALVFITIAGHGVPPLPQKWKVWKREEKRVAQFSSPSDAARSAALALHYLYLAIAVALISVVLAIAAAWVVWFRSPV